MRRHVNVAMKELVDSESAHKSLENQIYDILKELEEAGDYTKNEPISRITAKQFVEQVIIHTRNWVHVKRGRNTAVSFNAPMLGTAMNSYLRCPKAYRQFRSDDCFIQPSPSWMSKLKNMQKITHGPCVELCIPQPTYRGTGKEEWGQVGCDEMKASRGVGINVKNNEMTCMSNDFYDMNKIVKNLLDDDDIDKQYEPAVYVNQYCYRSLSGRVFNVMFFSTLALYQPMLPSNNLS